MDMCHCSSGTVWGVALYNNARKGQTVVKEVALQTLQKVAEQVVNREFDKLRVYHVSWDNNGTKQTKRQVITEEGEFEVTIDSLKEAQGLYLLEVVGYKADILNCYGKFPLEKIRSEWQEEMDARYRGTVCVLSLKITPLGKDVFKKHLLEMKQFVLHKTIWVPTIWTTCIR